MNMLKDVKKFLVKSDLGKIPFCNKRCDRAPHIGRFCFPLCWRCTAILISSITFYFIIIKTKAYTKFNIFICVFSFICLLPSVIDWIIQIKGIKESNNLKRALTGTIFGLGMVLLDISGFLLITDLIDCLL